MIKILQTGYKWAKASILWLMLPSNRRTAIKYIKMGLDVTEKATKLTKSKKDDIGVAYIAKQFDKATKSLSGNDIQKLADDITRDGGILKDVKLGYSLNDKKVKAKVGFFGAEYDPSNGDVKFGVSL
jgi:hypothetical protein